MDLIWRVKPCDEELTARLVSSCRDLPPPLVAVLGQRGCRTPDEVESFLNPVLSSLRDPFLLPDMEQAVQRIERALAEKESILVFGDYDVDGVCSTALLVRVLRDLGGRVSSYIPGRMEQGYGLSIESAEVALERHSPSLIITVDCGSSSATAVEWLRGRGTDTVVTDHHEPDGQLPAGIPVVNPKRDAAHPDRVLCGAGVAFKLCHALLISGRGRGCAASAALDLKEILPEVAVATVADMVPLLGENRALVRAGLRRLEKDARPGWKALCDCAGVRLPLQPWHAGFALGPRINAAGRVGRADDALELLLTSRAERARGLARALDEANRERQGIEQGLVREAIEEVEKRIQTREYFGLVVAREGWHPGVIGIVASRLVARYNRPVAVIGIENGRGRGSCRSVEPFDMLAGLSTCSDLLDRFGGHAMAAGLELSADGLDAFCERFDAAAAHHLRGVDLRPALEIDRAITLAEAGRDLLEGLRRAGPFGQDNPEPVWTARGLVAENSRILKEKHLRMTLRDGDIRCEAIGFHLAGKLPSGPVDAAFTVQENNWQGRSSVQLHLRDLRPAEK